MNKKKIAISLYAMQLSGRKAICHYDGFLGDRRYANRVYHRLAMGLA
jgi:hypothetical protein